MDHAAPWLQQTQRLIKHLFNLRRRQFMDQHGGGHQIKTSIAVVRFAGAHLTKADISGLGLFGGPCPQRHTGRRQIDGVNLCFGKGFVKRLRTFAKTTTHIQDP